MRVIRAFHKEAEETAQFAEENESLTRLQLFVGRISALMNPLTYVLINSAIVALIWTGAWQVERGALTQGQVVALVQLHVPDPGRAHQAREPHHHDHEGSWPAPAASKSVF